MTVTTPPVTTPRAAPRLWWRAVLRAVVLFVVVPYIAVGVLIATMQRQLLFAPEKTPRLRAADVSSVEQPIEDIVLNAAQGLQLHGWRFRATGQSLPSQPSVVLYFPGNAGCRRDRLADACDFTRLGCDVLLIDYRGYGENGGSPSEAFLAADARRLWIYATHELEVPPNNVILFGESLGGGVAIRLAAEMSQAGTPPAALIVNSTFASMGDTVAWHFPVYPFRYVLLDRFPSIQRLPHITCPFLQFHGTEDETVPFTQGERLFAAAPLSSQGIEKQFVKIPGAGHNMVSAADMHGAIAALFDQLNQR